MADERDPKVSRRYRELGGEEPSRELDQSILAAAHRAADKSHAPLVPPAGRHRWYFAFGAAAVLVLAIAVTVQVERERPDAESIVLRQQVPQQPPPAGEAPASTEAPPAKEPPPKRSIRPDPAPKTEKPPPQAARDAPPAAPSPAESSAPENREQSAAADAVRQEGLFSRQMQGARSRGAAPAAEPAPASENAREGRVAAAAVPLTPERLLERIAELRKEGRHKEADQALAEFRERYPDYRISEEMLKKVERKK